jgi:hypothetical protein
MGIEARFWSQIKRRKELGLWFRIENKVGVGMPDCVCLTEGVTNFVELKGIDRASSTMGLSRVQMHWLKRWCNAKGKAYLFAKVMLTSETHYFLVEGNKCYKQPFEDWIKNAAYHEVAAQPNWAAIARQLAL